MSPLLLKELIIIFLFGGMYENVRSCVRVCKGLSDEFEVKFGVHQGSVLITLLFITCLMLCHRRLEGSSRLGTELLCLPLQGKG